jgi:hypothetical protein
LPINIEGRKYRRVKVRWPIEIFTDQGTIQGEVKDITATGIFIQSKEQLHQNEVHRMVIGASQTSIDIQGKLIWSNIDDNNDNNDKGASFGMGICFVTISESDLEPLVKVISACLKRRRKNLT